MLTEISLNLESKLGRIDIFSVQYQHSVSTVLSISLHEHRLPFPYIWIFAFFHGILWFPVYRFCTYFVKYIARYFFGTIADGIVFWICNYNCSVPVYCNAIGICTSISHSMTLLYSWIHFRRICFCFCFCLFGILDRDNPVICEQRQFYFFFPNLYIFHSFIYYSLALSFYTG